MSSINGGLGAVASSPGRIERPRRKDAMLIEEFNAELREKGQAASRSM
jgi:hypothetical protein